MPRYFFTAKSLKGEDKSGFLEAKDPRELAKILRQQGFTLIFAREEEKKKRVEITLPIFGQVGLKEKIFFTRNLQMMISAGIGLPRALRILAEQARNKKFKRVLFEIAEEITKGRTFSETLTKYHQIFSELFQNMVKVGEETGTLDGALKKITQQMERENELKSKIKGALIYPAVIVCAMIGIGALMLITVVPRLAETFKELGVELPATTKLVISFGSFLAERWFLLPPIIFFFVFLFRFLSQTKIGKKFIDGLTLRLPIFSQIIKQTNSAYTVRNLSSLIASGVPIVRSLEVVSQTLGNIYFQQAIIAAAEKVRKGEKLSEGLKPYQKIYPPIVCQMIAVGEETGQTSEILEKLADFFEEEVSNATKNLASVIEPVIMLIIGAVVGFFAISMIQPMYSMLHAI